jgi:hypothetical protein
MWACAYDWDLMLAAYLGRSTLNSFALARFHRAGAPPTAYEKDGRRRQEGGQREQAAMFTAQRVNRAECCGWLRPCEPRSLSQHAACGKSCNRHPGSASIAPRWEDYSRGPRDTRGSASDSKQHESWARAGRGDRGRKCILACQSFPCNTGYYAFARHD